MRGCDLIESADVQLSFYEDAKHREKWECIDETVDRLRNRYGYMSVRLALMLSDSVLRGINPRDDHTVHPVGYF